MSEHQELIVEFKRGTTEDEARTVAKGAGGLIRRRMKTDSDELVMLLVRFPTDDFKNAKKKLSKDSSVARVENNDKEYGAL